LQIQLRQDGSLNPKPAAMLGCAGRDWDDKPDIFVLSTTHWIPAFAGMTRHDRAQESAPTQQVAGLDARLAQPSIAGKTGSSSRLSERIERSEIASCASAGFPEKRRVSGPESQIQARTSHRVPFSLGTFSWASKRKYLARGGETGGSVSHRQMNLAP
jgi:hypothetical protein